MDPNEKWEKPDAKDPVSLAKAVLAIPGDWPRAAPNAITSLAVFHAMLDLSTCSEASTKCIAFADAGGIRALVQILEETAIEIGRKARSIDYSNPEMNKSLQDLMMLADTHTMGCTLISNLGAVAEGCSPEAPEAVLQEELRVSKATATVVRSMMLYPENPSHQEAGLAALHQLQPIDPPEFIKVGAASVIVAAMMSQMVAPWGLYLGARVLARAAAAGAEEEAELKKHGAVPALVVAVRAPPDPDAGKDWGVSDVWAKIQTVARTTIAKLSDTEGFVCGGRPADHPGLFDLNTFLIQDAVVLCDVAAEPALDGSVAFITAAGFEGIGPNQSDGGLYGLTVEYPQEFKGKKLDLPEKNLRLMAPRPM